MYNLNINVATGAMNPNLLGVEACSTPKTPEILNSLMAMTNPFDNYRGPRIAAVPPGSSDSSSCSGGSEASPPPSVQHTCSQLIKEGLKLTIQSKRRSSGRLGSPLDDGPPCKLGKREEVGGWGTDYFSADDALTPEDEERRRRRRERNKIAATKCRLKKRERTVNLVQESEILESQNHDLKSQIQELQNQKNRLMEMLSMHSPTCMKNLRSGGMGSEQHQNTYESYNSAGNNPYHLHYANNSCSFNGGYNSSGVDSGCMA